MALQDPFLGREIHQSRQFSEHTQELIDEEVARILLEADQKAEQLLREHRADLDKVARALLEHEELGEAELTELVGPSIQARLRQDSCDTPPGAPLAPEDAAEHSPGPAVNQDPVANQDPPP